jgi:hypothetical protein
MLGSESLNIDLSRRGKCSGRHFNCGAHALTHVFIKKLMEDRLDRHFEETPSYQLLLSTFSAFYNIESALTVQNLKTLFSYYSHPYDREIIFGDVLRQFFSNIHANNEDYKSERKEYFKTILTHYIKKNNDLTPKRPLPSLLQAVDFLGWVSRPLNWFFPSERKAFGNDDQAVDAEFVCSHNTIQEFIASISSEFQRLSTNEIDPLDFLERHTGTGFYDQENIKNLINAFWDSNGFAAWLNYINTPGVYLPIDVLMNGSAALDFDTSVIIAGAYTWHNRIETAVEGEYTPRAFSMTAYNLNGGHYEVELDTPEEAKIHNLQLEGYGILEGQKKVSFNLIQAGIRAGKLQGRKIQNDQAPQAEITRFVKDMPSSAEIQSKWIQALNTLGRADRSIPRVLRKSVQSEYLTVLQWATLQASIFHKLQSDPTWVSTWHTALVDLNTNYRDIDKLIAWCETNLRPLSPFTEMPIEALIGWAKENIRIHNDFTEISEEQWAIEANDKGGLLDILLEQHGAVKTNIERKNIFDMIFEQWQQYNMSSLAFWHAYQHIPVGQALEAAQQILTLSADLDTYLPAESRPPVELLEECVKTGNLVELYKIRQQLYQYQFNEKSLPTLGKRDRVITNSSEPNSESANHEDKRIKITGPD